MVTLWSYEGKFKHNQFLGETCIPFETHKFSESPEEITERLHQEGDEGGDEPTLYYDSSLDLTAVLDDNSQAVMLNPITEKVLTPSRQTLMEVFHRSVHSCQLKNQDKPHQLLNPHEYHYFTYFSTIHFFWSAIFCC